MKRAILKTLSLVFTFTMLTAFTAHAANLGGRVQVAGKPVAGAAVTLFAAAQPLR
jgi:hypothetical protein